MPDPHPVTDADILAIDLATEAECIGVAVEELFHGSSSCVYRQ